MNSNTQQVQTEKDLNALLEKYSIEQIKLYSEIEKLFSPSSLERGDVPQINVDYDCMILFDTPVFNSSYLFDLFCDFKDNFLKLPLTDYARVFGLKQENIAKEIEFVSVIKEKLKTQLPKTKIFYCKDEDIYKKLFERYIKSLKESGKMDIGENELLFPVILTLKGNTHKNKDIIINMESISTLTNGAFISQLTFLYDYNQIAF